MFIVEGEAGAHGVSESGLERDFPVPGSSAALLFDKGHYHILKSYKINLPSTSLRLCANRYCMVCRETHNIRAAFALTLRLVCSHAIRVY